MADTLKDFALHLGFAWTKGSLDTLAEQLAKSRATEATKIVRKMRDDLIDLEVALISNGF